MYSCQFFRVRCIVRHVVEAQKSGTPCFSCRSLLLSTNVLNDGLIIFNSTCHGHYYNCLYNGHNHNNFSNQMYIFILTHTHANAHTRIHSHTSTHTYIHTHAHMYTHIHTHTRTHSHIYTCKHVHTYHTD